jgi:hypothetical protein
MVGFLVVLAFPEFLLLHERVYLLLMAKKIKDFRFCFKERNEFYFANISTNIKCAIDISSKETI